MLNPFRMMERAFTETARSMATVAENPAQVMNPTHWVRPMVETARAGMAFDKPWDARDLASSTKGATQATADADVLADRIGGHLGLLDSLQAALARTLARSPSGRAVIENLSASLAEDASPARKQLALRLVRRMAQPEADSVFDQMSGAMFTTAFGFMMPGGGARPRQGAEPVLAERGAGEVQALRQLAAKRNFVFVGGFGGEHMGDDYFAPTRDVLRGLGAETVSKVQPPSLEPVEANADRLVDELLTRFHLGGNKPLTVIAHSKGGAETMQAILENPALVRLGIVKDALVVQGAVRGTPAASRLRGTMSTPATMMLPPAMVGAAVMDGAVNSLSDAVRGPAIDGAVRSLSAEDRAALDGAIRYVRTSGGALPGAMAQALASSMPGAHDGLLPYDRQHVPGLGQDVAVPGTGRATHMDFVYDDRASSLSTADKQRASVAMLLGLV